MSFYLIICSLWPDPFPGLLSLQMMQLSVTDYRTIELMLCLYLSQGCVSFPHIYLTRSFIPLIGQCPINVELTFEPQGTEYTLQNSFSQSFFSFWTGNRDKDNWRGNFLWSFVGYSQKNMQEWICEAVSIMCLTKCKCVRISDHIMTEDWVMCSAICTVNWYQSGPIDRKPDSEGTDLTNQLQWETLGDI